MLFLLVGIFLFCNCSICARIDEYLKDVSRLKDMLREKERQKKALFQSWLKHEDEILHFQALYNKGDVIIDVYQKFLKVYKKLEAKKEKEKLGVEDKGRYSRLLMILCEQYPKVEKTYTLKENILKQIEASHARQGDSLNAYKNVQDEIIQAKETLAHINKKIRVEKEKERIKTVNEILHKELDNITPPKDFKVIAWGGKAPNYDWMQFDRRSKYVKKPKLKKKESQFFDALYVQDWTAYYRIWGDEKLDDIARSVAFIDVDKGVRPHTGPFKLNNKRLNTFYKKNANKAQLMQQEVIKGWAHRFKLHFQIKPEYLPIFTRRFLHLLKTDSRLQHVEAFKVAYTIEPGANYYDNEGNVPEDASSIVAVYLPLIPFEKRYIVADILKAVEEGFQDVLGVWWLKISPRFNQHIKGFIYLSGGDGDSKKIYKRAVQEGLLPRNYIYTDGYIFFKGYAPFE